jgi:hypothetical protein
MVRLDINCGPSPVTSRLSAIPLPNARVCLRVPRLPLNRELPLSWRDSYSLHEQMYWTPTGRFVCWS